MITAWLLGRSLPARHEVSLSRDIERPQEDVAAQIRDIARQAEWRADVKRIELLRREGDVQYYIEHGSNGAIPFAFAEIEPGRRFTSTIDSEQLPFSGTWTIELSALSERSTHVTITERGEVHSAIFRALARYVFGHTRTMARYLDALAMPR